MENAINYTPENGKIYLGVRSEGKDAIIEITDTGPGIDPKDIPFIFKRFYRVDSSRSKKDVKGFGLGLSVAKKIVELHNGSISVSSKPGYGSTFITRIPLA